MTRPQVTTSKSPAEIRRAEDALARRREAEHAWDVALRPARLPLGDPFRVPYPIAARDALAAYDSALGGAV